MYLKENKVFDEWIKNCDVYDIDLKHIRNLSGYKEYAISFHDKKINTYFDRICDGRCFIIIKDDENMIDSIFLSDEAVSKKYGLGVKIIDKLLTANFLISFKTNELSPYSRKMIVKYIKNKKSNFVELTDRIILIKDKYTLDHKTVYEKIKNILYYIGVSGGKSTKLKSDLSKSDNKKILNLLKNEGLVFGISKSDKMTKILSILSKNPDKIDKYKDFILLNYTPKFIYSFIELFKYHPRLIIPLKEIAIEFIYEESSIYDVFKNTNQKTRDFLTNYENSTVNP